MIQRRGLSRQCHQHAVADSMHTIHTGQRRVGALCFTQSRGQGGTPLQCRVERQPESLLAPPARRRLAGSLSAPLVPACLASLRGTPRAHHCCCAAPAQESEQQARRDAGGAHHHLLRKGAVQAAFLLQQRMALAT